MELLEAKILAILTLILGTLLVGLLPGWFSAYSRNNYPLFISSLLCFGGGVLLATAVVHMLPEIRENLPSELVKWSELLFCSGFFLLYLIDELVHCCFPNAHQHQHQEVEEPHRRRATYGSTESEPLIYERRFDPEIVESPETQLCHIGHNEPQNSTPVGCVALLAALSTHALLEGLAVGLEESASKVLLLLGAIASHKLVVGFCLGVEIASMPNITTTKHFLSVLVFTVGTPIGIGLGMLVSEIPKNVTVYLLPLLQCLAGGTLLYISVCEVLPRERARWHQTPRKAAGIMQFIAVLGGFILMTMLTMFIED